MRLLKPEKFTPSEALSTHGIQAYTHPGCPIDEACFRIIGGGMKRCKYLKDSEDEEKVYCMYVALRID